MTFWTGAGFKVLQNSELPSRQSFYYFNVIPAGSMTRVKVSGSRWRSKTRRWRKFSKNRKFSLRKTTIKEYSFDGWLCQLNNFKSSLRIWYPCLPHGFFLAFMLHLPTCTMVQRPKALVKQTWWTTNYIFSCDIFGTINNTVTMCYFSVMWK